MSTSKPVVLCILDGWGLRFAKEGNAVLQAKTPHFDRIMQGPSASLITFGTDVGLPEGQMGNSEVGHMNIGAGRVVNMDLHRINRLIDRGEFAKLSGIRNFGDALLKSKGVAHLMGVLSDGGVHSHIDHMIATAKALTNRGVDVILHLFTDGRDVAPTSAIDYLGKILASAPDGVKIGTIMGRYFPMDRDNRWDRIEKAFNAIVHAKGVNKKTARIAITDSYENDVNDEFIEPVVLDGYKGVQENDGVMLMNFRADRAREIMSAIGDPSFDSFDTGQRPKLAALVGMAEYSDHHTNFMDSVFVNEDLKNTLGEWVAKHGLSQYRIAETEKYPHVTFFLNGGVETPSKGEDRYLASSPKVATYDLQPEMSAPEVTQNLVATIKAQLHNLIIVNYANPDMVGHTGDLNAAIAACEEVDRGLGQVTNALDETGGTMLICADHGNCETMIDPETGEPHTAHTTNLVPIALYNGPTDMGIRDGGRLADIAPTLLKLLNLSQPKEMTGKSLLV